jgi:hypothetical protein
MDQASSARSFRRIAFPISAAVAVVAAVVGGAGSLLPLSGSPESPRVSRTSTLGAWERATADKSNEEPARLREAEQSLDQALRELRRANIAFNTPTTLRLDETSVIKLLMSHRVPISELQGRLNGVGDRVGVSIQASDVMEADLAGIDFKVQDITPAEQPVLRKGITQWKWEVEPTEVGRRRPNPGAPVAEHRSRRRQEAHGQLDN